MIQRFLKFCSVFVIVLTTITSSAYAQTSELNAATVATTIQSIKFETVVSDCSHVNKAEVADMQHNAVPASPNSSNDCCKHKCACPLYHCGFSVVPFGNPDFATVAIKIEKSEFPRVQILASLVIDPLKRPPRI